MVAARSLEIREFRPSDYDAMARIFNAIHPDRPRSSGELRYWDESVDRNKYVLKRYSAVETEHGHIVGYGDYRHSADLFHPKKFWIGLNVDPAMQRRGIGTMLYERIMRDMAEIDAITVRADVREDKPDSISFVKKRGFAERMRAWESHLDVQEFDSSRFPGYVERMAGQGITTSSLRELSEQDPQCHRKLYDLLKAVTADMPSPDTFTPLSFEDLMRNTVLHPNCLQDGFFIARDGERYVGLSNLFKSEEQRGDLHQQDTGVLRDYRRRGIAMALKLEGIKFAKACGANVIKTGNDSTNEGMLAINVKLGFQRHVGWIMFEKNLQQ